MSQLNEATSHNTMLVRFHGCNHRDYFSGAAAGPGPRLAALVLALLMLMGHWRYSGHCCP